jgi:carboxypeptidase family protein
MIKPDFLRMTFARMMGVAVLLLGLFLSLSSAQTVNTRVSGTIKDSSGAVIPGVELKLVDVGTREEKTAQSNDEGFFVFVNVRPGTYTVLAERQGFKKAEVQNVVVHIDSPANLSIELETGAISESVSVQASDTQAIINLEDAKLSKTIELKQVQDLPLNGRNPINIAGNMAGVNTNGSVRTSAINGMRGSFSNITWDGIDINDNLVRTDSLFGTAGQSVAGVAELTITTQNGGPDDGLGIAQVKLTTPRGTKSFHGQGYDFYRNSRFDANTFFNNATRDPLTGKALPKPGLVQHQYGFNVGGPFALPRFGEGGPSLAQKNKLFFYFAYEAVRTTSEDTRLRTVLSSGARTGNFTYARADNGQLQTVNVLSLTGRSIDPRIQTLLNLVPLSNNNDRGDTRNTQGFRFNSPSGSTSDLYVVRFDYDIAPNHHVEAIYDKFIFDFPNDTFNDIGEVYPGLPGGGQGSIRPRASFAYHWNPSATITNEARFGFFKTNPSFLTKEKFDVGYRLTIPLINNPIQNFLKQGRSPTNYDLIDNLTWVKGDHLFRFGTIHRSVPLFTFNDANILPTYALGFNSVGNINPLVRTNTAQFPGGISTSEFTNVSNLLALLTGAVSSAAQTFNVGTRESGFVKGKGTERNMKYTTLAFYGGDTWRFRRNLTINYGLRWEYISPITEVNGLGLLPKVTSIDALKDPNAILDFAGDGTGRPFYNKDLNNFAPSVSFAWDPFKDGKTSLRAGFSMSYAIDNNVTVLQNAAINGNSGLSSARALTGLGGTVSGGGIIPIDPPAFKVPRTLIDQLTLSQTPTIFTVDPNLKTPYVEQWTLGFEREIMRDTAISVSYVGNAGHQLTRGVDTNQTVIFQNGFFADFLRAQANLALTGNPACTTAGCQTLTVFPKIGLGGNLADSGFRTLISQGQVGELASQYVQLRNTYLTVGTNGATIGPGFFLPTNPNAFVTDYVGSGSYSNYHGLQAEIRKRLSNGFYYQANYTWSKAFTDADQSQTEFAGFLDLTLGNTLEKKRISQDVKHVFKGNAVYELPFGPGRKFVSGGGALGRILGGWQVSGLFQARTGRPISFISGRGTVNRSGRSGKNTATTSVTITDLQKMTGLFFNPTTGRPQLFDPKLVGTDGRANPAFLTHPLAGQFGNLSLTPVSGPGYWNIDAALIKRTRITETTNFELRLEAFNLTNHTNFSVSEDNDINSTDFGKITSAFEPRILQFAVKFNF